MSTTVRTIKSKQNPGTQNMPVNKSKPQPVGDTPFGRRPGQGGTTSGIAQKSSFFQTLFGKK